MSRKVPEIFECEYQLMQLIWNHKKPMRMRKLVEEGYELREWKRTTIYTMVKRLADRGVVKFEDGFVSARFSKEQVQLAKSQEFINKIYGGEISGLISAFTDKKKISKEEAEEICQVLDEYLRDANE